MLPCLQFDQVPLMEYAIGNSRFKVTTKADGSGSCDSLFDLSDSKFDFDKFDELIFLPQLHTINPSLGPVAHLKFKPLKIIVLP